MPWTPEASSSGGADGCHQTLRVYTFPRYIARQALPLLLKEIGSTSLSHDLLIDGLAQLAQNHPELRKDLPALAKRAVRQHEKLLWALPQLDEEEAMKEICRAGFAHGAVLCQRIRAVLPNESDHRITKAFRKAIDELKAKKLSNAGLEEAALDWLRRNDRFGSASTDLRLCIRM